MIKKISLKHKERKEPRFWDCNGKDPGTSEKEKENSAGVESHADEAIVKQWGNWERERGRRSCSRVELSWVEMGNGE